MKLLLKFTFLVVLFFGTWFVLLQFDWMTILKVQQIKKTTEEKLGDLFWDMFKAEQDVIRRSEIAGPIDSLVTHLCRKNGIERKKLKLHIVDNDVVNAFTLPDDHLVVFTGLIKEVETESEFVGVLGHEIAHAQNNHVMKKLMKEVGMSVLISMTNGSAGELARESLQSITSSAFDRELEREADLDAADYMMKADVDPEGLATFLYRMADDERDMPRAVFWLSSHPESRERAEAIIMYIKGKDFYKQPVLSDEAWKALKAEVEKEKE